VACVVFDVKYVMPNCMHLMLLEMQR